MYSMVSRELSRQSAMRRDNQCKHTTLCIIQHTCTGARCNGNYCEGEMGWGALTPWPTMDHTGKNSDIRRQSSDHIHGHENR